MQNFQRLSIFNIVTSNLKNKFKKLKNLINRFCYMSISFKFSAAIGDDFFIKENLGNLEIKR